MTEITRPCPLFALARRPPLSLHQYVILCALKRYDHASPTSLMETLGIVAVTNDEVAEIGANLRVLQSHGYVREVGKERRPNAGRPRTLFAITDKAIPAITRTAEHYEHLARLAR